MTERTFLRSRSQRAPQLWPVLVMLQACGIQVGMPSEGGMPDGPDAVSAETGTLDARTTAPEGASCADPEGPQVRFASPEAILSDDILFDARFLAVCKAEPHGEERAAVDTRSVAIEVLDARGDVVAAPQVSRSSAGRYEATLDLSELENGPITLRCSARDTTEEERCASESLELDLDLGPRVVVESPQPDEVLSGAVTVRYRVEADPIDESDDDSARVVEHEVELGGRTVEGNRDGNAFVATLAFDDPEVFPTALEGPQELVIVARNARTPVAGERRIVVPFRADSSGPEVRILEPDSGDQAGSQIRVEARVEDMGVGVDPEQVVARAGERETAMRRSPDNEKVFWGTLDTSSIDPDIREVTVNVVAKDRAGNASIAAVVVKLDTRAPLVSLNPPPVRAVKTESDIEVCSELFDPIGADSVDDGEVVDAVAEFRARIEDRGNGEEDARGEVVFLAGLDDDTMFLYLARASGQALLIDDDGDGTCDAINPDREPRAGNAEAATVVPLGPVRDSGKAAYLAGSDATQVPVERASAYGPAGTSVFDGCGSPLSTGTPDPVCGSSDLTRIIGAQGYSNPPPAIYGKEPIDRVTTCAGDAFDFRETLPEGWACAVAVAADELGNVGYSTPLRVCFTDGDGDDPCGAPVGSRLGSDLPECTDGCLPPVSFEDFPFRQLIR